MRRSCGHVLLRRPIGRNLDALATVEPQNLLPGRAVDTLNVPRTLESLTVDRCGFVKIDVEGHTRIFSEARNPVRSPHNAPLGPISVLNLRGD